MPKVSVVIPTYNVARWLPEFLSSLDAQTGGLHGYELIFVDDGSPDESAALISAWIARSQCDARLITKTNGGLASARNAGLAVAGGEWVTFWDPDDKLSPPYATEVREFVESPAAADVDLIVGRLVKFAEATGRRSTHPLDHRFARGDRVFDLESEPDAFHLAANTAFFRTERLARHGLEFDGRVVPSFEDGHLVARYLGKVARPRVAVRSRARYLYRSRADQSSLVQAGWQKDSKYLAQPRYGWLDLLQSVQADRGQVPAWAQYMVLYEIGWYLRSEEMAPSRTAWVGPELSAAFHEILAEVAALLQPDIIERFAHSASNTPPDLIPALLIGAKNQQRRPTHVTVDQIDVARRVTRLRYYFDGAAADEVFEVAGRQVRPRHVKTRSITLLGRPMAAERIAWVSATDTVSVALDGVRLPVRIGPVEHPYHDATPARTWPALAQRPAPTAAAKAPQRRGRELVHAAREFKRRLPKGRAAARRMLDEFVARKVSTAPPARRTFHDAWLLMDEPRTARGDAEHLYRYLVAEHAEVNAWFVLRRDSRDWERLAADGFRLLEHRSNRHRTALLNASHVVSSTAEESAVNPLERKRFGPRQWRWTCLPAQPFDLDLANWLNPRPIDLTLVATRAQFDSIVGDGTRYRHTSLEVLPVGRPAHDALLRADRAGADRRTLLFVPGLRRTPWTKPRSFADATSAQAWSALIGAERLHKAAAAAGYRLAALLHADEVSTAALPEHVSVHRHGESNVADLLVGCAAFVTDRSWLVHEAGYLNRPVVLCRFDDGRAVPGLAPHTEDPGAGLGPVCPDPDSALETVVGLVESGCAATERDVEFRDGRCCERAYERIRALAGPASAGEVYGTA